MHLVVDAVVVRLGSVTIVMEHLVRAWHERFPDDQITVLFDPDGPNFELPDGVAHESLPQRPGPLGSLWIRSGALRRATNRLGADAVLASVPATGLLGSRCPRGVILYDLRFELRPEQFSRRTRIARQISWGWSMRLADGIFCISDRTLTDLKQRHPRLARRGVAALLGSDHALTWPPPIPGHRPYAIAFGHYGNKNADSVIEGWAAFCSETQQPAETGWLLRLVGMGAADRAAAAEQVQRLGIADHVELMPWLADDDFEACFSGADLVLFPSDFEGFGLPAAEALRLGIPAVISTDPALVEITGGHAITAATTSASDLAAAIRGALALTPDQLAAGQAFAESFTWRRTAEVIRAGLT